MSGVPLIAAARQLYDGRQLFPGNEFEVGTEEEADDLVALNFARRPKGYHRQSLTTKTPSPATPKRNDYRNRNLKATP
jgi:hypothetical protein